MAKKETKFMPRNAVAEMFGVTPQTVSNWLADGILQGTTIKGNRFATVESVHKLIKLYPEAGPDANYVEYYRKKIKTLQDELQETKDGLRRERIYRHYAPRYLMNFIGKFVRIISSMIGESDRNTPLLQSQFIRCWLFGHDIAEVCKENNVPYYKYIASTKQYLKALRNMDTYADMIQRNRELEEEIVRLKAENERLKTDMDEYRDRFKSVENEQTAKENYPVLNERIIDLDFTVRTMNILKIHGFETLGQVVKYSKGDLLKLRHFGKKSLTEIIDFLEQYGLELGINYDCKSYE